MLKFTLLLAALSCAHAFTIQDLSEEEWSSFKLEHNKVYELEAEEQFRYKVFNEHRLMIAKHNQLYAEGKVSYDMAINEFSDMPHSEFLEYMTGFNNSFGEESESETEGVTFISPANVVLSSTVDWRKMGAVTAVKNQGRCGSCWAFSATGSVEGQHFRKTHTLVSLSEQNLIDCSVRFGNHGCNGGSASNAFNYIKHNRGIDTEESYKYTALDGKCHFSPRSVGAKVHGLVHIPGGNEKKLKEAVATVGPVSVAIDASWESFQHYHSGVYDEPKCKNGHGHAVLVVGYGNENGRDYWLVKNSWGARWGNSGYIKMSRNKRNQCGIASWASYPVV